MHIFFFVFFFFINYYCIVGEGMFTGVGTGNGGNSHNKLEDNNCPRQTWIPASHHISARSMHHRTYIQLQEKQTEINSI